MQPKQNENYHDESNNPEQEINRFAGVQRIILFFLLIVLLIFISSYFLPQQGGENSNNVSILEPAADVRGEDSSLFGNIRIKTADGLSLGSAKVLINGVDYGDLGKGELLLRVYPGDVISIDGSEYKKELEFLVSAISSNIDKDFLQMTIYTNGDSVEVGIIVFK